MTDLPYFDLLLAGQGEPAAEAFSRFVHWGYWEDPSRASLDRAEFAAAMERLNGLVVDAGGPKDGEKVLDAGCGFGGTLAGLSKRLPGAKLTGLNIDGRQLVLARKNAPGVEFVEGDACAMPFADASFDRVLAVECIFHFPSRLKFLQEAARVLKPGGTVALSDFVPPDPTAPESLPGRWVRKKIEVGYGTGGAGWDDGDYAAMAAKAGLVVTLDRDITSQVQPTYPVLLDLIGKSKGGERMLWPTRLLSWVSKLGAVRYRVVGFKKPS